MRATLAAALAVCMVTIVFAFVYPHLWYGEYDISDIVIYQEHSLKMATGQLPYRDFDLEYPPLAAAVFALPGHQTGFLDYARWFTFVMFLATAGTGAAVAVAASRFWPTGGRAYVCAVLFGLSVAAAGAIVENRYDAVVALTMAAALMFLSRRQVVGAAIVLGLGFALKLTPAILLPLVLILAPTKRRALWAMAAFLVTAIAPFIPYVAMAPQGVLHIFTYHMQRPLQIESVLATPFLAAGILGRMAVQVTTSFGSQGIIATGAEAMARFSTWLSAIAMVGVYALIWQRRRALLARPSAVPLAALAVVLAFLTFGKVLSPQYVVWLLPFAALVALEDYWTGLLTFAVLMVTQVYFPAKYWGIVYLEPASIWWLVARNALVVLTFGVCVWALARVREPHDLMPAQPLAKPREATD